MLAAALLIVLSILAPQLGEASEVSCSSKRTDVVNICPSKMRYRPIDGSCNNLKNPELGRANTTLLRIVKPDYSGEAGPRLSSKGKPLPSARTIVTKLFPQENHTTFTTHLFVIWGQLLSHDFAKLAAPRNQAKGPCCENGAGKECVSISVRKDDPFYSQFNVVCLPLERSNRTTCGSRYAEQLTLVTHFLDASFVYGSDDGTMSRLRCRRGGLLRYRKKNGAMFPPNVKNPKEACGHEPCYEGGDPRLNQNPMLAALQVLLLREHNRVAKILAELNQRWDDERLFQEARRIVVAEWQLITYRDWLQWMLGVDRVREIKLVPGTTTASSEYREDVDPRTANDVTTGSYRSFHSMVQGQFWLGRAPLCSHFRTAALGEYFENPGPILEEPRGMLHTLEGLTYQRSQDQDRWIDNEITQQLRPVVENDGRRWGNDLSAIDIQRAREHGIPGYAVYREHVGLPKAADFDDLKDTLDEKHISALREIYDHVDDVDYYVGGLLERHKANGVLAGPTFQPFLEDQFYRWRFGDRFFYNFVGFEHSFSEEQLKALEGTSTSRMFCDNVPGFKKVPLDPFIVIGHLGNKEESCSDLPQVDFSSWKE